MMKEVKDVYQIPSHHIYETIGQVLPKYIRPHEVEQIKNSLRTFEVSYRMGSSSIAFDFDRCILEMLKMFSSIRKFTHEELFFTADVSSSL